MTLVRAERLPICLLCVAVALTAACQDPAKVSAKFAARDVADLAAVVDKDVGEVERGLPEGAKRLAPLVANHADPKQNLPDVRRALLRVRRDVLDLTVAKSTFFALADPGGVAIRNDLEQDVMAGQNLVSLFPALAKATDGFVSTLGAFPNVSTKNGPDRDWVAAVPVRREDGTTGALFVTGWTYRYFARHLQETLSDRLADRAKKDEANGKLPVFYAFVFDPSGAYGAPTTPGVDEKALTALDLVAKTASGPVQGAVTIEERPFGFAALRTPRLGQNIGVVVLRSET
ncbi:MAG: hypothetical protein ABTD50_00375 [Polyangiaceae bacterium]|jgi:hypothetical protein